MGASRRRPKDSGGGAGDWDQGYFLVFFLFLLIGKAAEKRVAKVVGLIMSENEELPGTVKHLYLLHVCSLL